MLKDKNKAFPIFYIIFGLILFFPSLSHADCTDPVAPKGGFAYFSTPEKTYRYCDGENWIDIKRQYATDESPRINVVLPAYSNIALPELVTPDALMKLQAAMDAPEGGAR